MTESKTTTMFKAARGKAEIETVEVRGGGNGPGGVYYRLSSGERLLLECDVYVMRKTWDAAKAYLVAQLEGEEYINEIRARAAQKLLDETSEKLVNAKAMIEPATAPGSNQSDVPTPCEVCGKPVLGYVPQYCCPGTDCGCIGLPIECCLCGPECERAAFEGDALKRALPLKMKEKR